MREVEKGDLIKIFREKGFDPQISWFYIQFKNKFEEEYNIYEIGLNDAYENLFDFLKYEDIKEVLFFPEPCFEPRKYGQSDIPCAFVKLSELKNFLRENVNTFTNCHVADKDLKWIFTITHHEDFFISAEKKFAEDCVKFFGKGKIMSRSEIEEKFR
jgi:hypothetical protein